MSKVLKRAGRQILIFTLILSLACPLAALAATPLYLGDGQYEYLHKYSSVLPKQEPIDLMSMIEGKGPLNWMIMGDSISAPTAHSGTEDSWSQFVEQRVKMELGRDKDTFINVAISGFSNSSFTNDYYERVLKYKPDIVLIFLGMNGGHNKDQVLKMYSDITDQNPDAIIIPIITSPQKYVAYDEQQYGGGDNRHTWNVAQTNREIAEEAGLPYIDLMRGFMEKREEIEAIYGTDKATSSDPDKDDPEFEYRYFRDIKTLMGHNGLPDDIHPGNNGHLLIAKLVLQGLNMWDLESSEVCRYIEYEDYVWGEMISHSVSPDYGVITSNHPDLAKIRQEFKDSVWGSKIFPSMTLLGGHSFAGSDTFRGIKNLTQLLANRAVNDGNSNNTKVINAGIAHNGTIDEILEVYQKVADAGSEILFLMPEITVDHEPSAEELEHYRATLEEIRALAEGSLMTDDVTPKEPSKVVVVTPPMSPDAVINGYINTYITELEAFATDNDLIVIDFNQVIADTCEKDLTTMEDWYDANGRLNIVGEDVLLGCLMMTIGYGNANQFSNYAIANTTKDIESFYRDVPLEVVSEQQTAAGWEVTFNASALGAISEVSGVANGQTVAVEIVDGQFTVTMPKIKNRFVLHYTKDGRKYHTPAYQQLIKEITYTPAPKLDYSLNEAMDPITSATITYVGNATRTITGDCIEVTGFTTSGIGITNGKIILKASTEPGADSITKLFGARVTDPSITEVLETEFTETVDADAYPSEALLQEHINTIAVPVMRGDAKGETNVIWEKIEGDYNVKGGTYKYSAFIGETTVNLTVTVQPVNAASSVAISEMTKVAQNDAGYTDISQLKLPTNVGITYSKPVSGLPTTATIVWEGDIPEGFGKTVGESTTFTGSLAIDLPDYITTNLKNEYTVTVTVVKVDADSFAVTEGLQVWLDATGRSNSDENKEVWPDKSGNGYEATLSGIDFDDKSGWTGEALRLKKGSSVKLPEGIFNDEEFTIEMTYIDDFDYDTHIINYEDPNMHYPDDSYIGRPDVEHINTQEYRNTVLSVGSGDNQFKFYESNWDTLGTYYQMVPTEEDGSNLKNPYSPAANGFPLNTIHSVAATRTAVNDTQMDVVQYKGASVVDQDRQYQRNIGSPAISIGMNPSIKHDSSKTEYAEGRIYSLRIYDRALSQAELAQNHFMDVVNFYGLDVTAVEDASESVKAELYQSFKDVVLKEDGREQEAASLQQKIDDMFAWVGSDLSVQDGLQFYFDGTGSGNTMEDKSINGLSGTISGTANWTGSSLTFDGTQVATFAESLIPDGNHTIQIMYKDTGAAESYLFSNDSYQARLYSDAGSDYAAMMYANALTTEGTTAKMPAFLTQRGQVNLYTATRQDSDDTTMLTANGTSIVVEKPTFNSEAQTFIGAKDAAAANGFTGELYTVRVYNRVLTEDELLVNRFVDVAKFYGLDLTGLYAVEEENRAVVYKAFADVTFDMDKTAVQDRLNAAVKGAVIDTNDLVVRDGLVFYIDGKGSGSTVLDKSGSGYSGTASKALTWTGNAISLDGSTTVTFGANKDGINRVLPNGSFTYEVTYEPVGEPGPFDATIFANGIFKNRMLERVNPESQKQEQGIFSQYQGSQYVGANFYQNTSWIKNIPYALSVTRDDKPEGGTTMAVSWNMVQKASTDFDKSTVDSAMQLNDTDIATVGQGLNGKLYAIRVYDRALTEAERAQNYLADLVSYAGLSVNRDTLSEEQIAALAEKYKTADFSDATIQSLTADLNRAQRKSQTLTATVSLDSSSGSNVATIQADIENVAQDATVIFAYYDSTNKLVDTRIVALPCNGSNTISQDYVVTGDVAKAKVFVWKDLTSSEILTSASEYLTLTI